MLSFLVEIGSDNGWSPPDHGCLPSGINCGGHLFTCNRYSHCDSHGEVQQIPICEAYRLGQKKIGRLMCRSHA